MAGGLVGWSVGWSASVSPVAPSAKSRDKKNTFYMKLFIPARGSQSVVQSHCINIAGE